MRHFPKIEEIQEWTNPYTGQTMKPSEGLEGERQGNFSQNAQGISRRNQFFNPRTVKVKREEEEQEAEIIPRDELKRTFKSAPLLAKTAQKAESLNFAEPLKPLEASRPVILSTSKAGPNVSRDITRLGNDMQSQQENTASLKNPLVNNIELKKSGFVKDAGANYDPNFSNDFVGREVNGSSNIQGSASFDINRVDDLVIDILSHKVGNSQLAQSCADYALKLALDAKESQKDFTGERVKASVVVDYSTTDRLEVPKQLQLSSDVVYAVQRSKSADWKNDDLEQSRIGSWAIDVARKNLGAVNKESLKPDALKALGRLAMQSLHLASASQKHDFKGREEDTGERQTTDYTSFKENIKQVANLRDLMKEESFRQDLQALQDGLLLEKSADEVMETFLETLRDENIDEEKSRSRKDILIGNAASSEYETNFVHEIGLSDKVSRVILDEVARVDKGKVHFKDDVDSSVSVKKTFDSVAKQHVFTVDRGVPPRKSFAILEVDADESVRQKYTSDY